MGAAARDRNRRRPPHLFRSVRVLPRAACRSDVSEFACVPETAVRLSSRRSDYGPAGRLLRRRKRRRHGRAVQRRDLANLTLQLRVRNDRRQRSDEHHHEPRAGSRGDDGSGGAFGSILSAAVRRQGVAGAPAAGVHRLFLPDDTARRRAALVSRGHRRVRGHVDGRRPGAGAGRLRRDGVPLDGARRHAVLRSARAGIRGHANRLPGRGQLVFVRHAVHDVARATLFAGEADRVGVAPRRQPRYYSVAVQSCLRHVARGGVELVGEGRDHLPAAQSRRHPRSIR